MAQRHFRTRDAAELSQPLPLFLCRKRSDELAVGLDGVADASIPERLPSAGFIVDEDRDIHNVWDDKDYRDGDGYSERLYRLGGDGSLAQDGVSKDALACVSSHHSTSTRRSRTASLSREDDFNLTFCSPGERCNRVSLHKRAATLQKDRDEL
ncbi:hypothetical protein BDZ89DRAFT_769327 [Hymenopellis radicata]|nr:hypothetical protein BDZ89DRAFT_769327 [Hymenopellis radicata]